MADQPPPPPGFVPVEPRPPGPPRGFIPVEEMIDRRSGAPAQVRLAVGSAPTDQDRLTTLQRFYPDAQPYRGNNFLFSEPGTKRQTLYNPSGLDFGDVASAAPEVGEMAGGTLGAALAAMQAAPSGGITAPYAIPAGMGLGAAAGRESTIALARALLGTQDTRDMGQRVSDIAITGGLNAVGARIGELASNAVRGGIRGLTGAARAPDPAQAVANARAIGVDLPPGAATGSTATQRMEKGLSILPGATDVVQGAYTQAAEQTGEAAARTGRALAGGAAPLTKEGAGDVVRTAAQGAQARFREQQGRLYDAAFDLIGRDTPVQLPGVQRLAGELTQELAQAPEARAGVLNPVIQRAQALLADSQNGIPFEALRAVRTDLGRLLDEPGALTGTGTTQQQLRRLYGALTEDIGAAARATSPEADRAMRLADRYTRFNVSDAGGRIPNADIIQKVIDSGSGEKAYQFAMQGAKDGGTRLQGLRRNMRPEEWDAVSSTVWDQMGRAKPGQNAFGTVDEAADFSPASFVTNWNSMAPEAKRALFGGTRYAGMAADMERIGRTAQRLNEVSRQANYSNTANLIGSGGVAFAAMGNLLNMDIAGGAATIAGGYVLPRVVASTLMNSPRFVNWLAHVPTNNNRALAEHLGRLGVIAAAEPTIRDEVRDFEAALREAPAIKAVQKR